MGDHAAGSSPLTYRFADSPIRLPRLRALGPARSRLALRNWRVTWRLVALIAIPTMMGLLFGSLRIAAAASSAREFSQTEQLALLAQQNVGLVQAMEDERDLAAGYIAAGRPSRMLAHLEGQYAVTDAWAGRVRSLVARIGPGYPVQARESADVITAMLGDLPGVRLVAQSGTAGSLPVILDYSAMLSNMLGFNEQVAQGSANSELAITAGTLSSLADMKEDTSQQRAILYAALLEKHFESGAAAQLADAQAQQDSDFVQFENSLTLGYQDSFGDLTTDPGLTQDQVLEQLAESAGSPQAAGISPSQWYSLMSSTIASMDSGETQLATSIVAQSRTLEQGAARSALLTSALSLALLLMAGIATFIVAGSMVRPLRRLRSDALDIARVRLPERVRVLREAEEPMTDPDVDPVGVYSVDEIGQVARAFDQVHGEALRLAGNEAVLRNNMNAMFISLSRRSQSLLERLVRLIESLEQSEDDPGRLSNLFAMDHLVTRMRRHSENLLVLAGREPARKRAEEASMMDVVRAAASEIEEYDRVIADVQRGIMISGQSVISIVHLLAEIIENATIYSPQQAQVHVSGYLLETGGALIEVSDSGIGIPTGRLAELNRRLDDPPTADVSVSRHMGLFAVAHLAARHGIRVRLLERPAGGLTVLIWIPATSIAAASPLPPLADPGRMQPRPRSGSPDSGPPGTATSAAPGWFGRGGRAILSTMAPAPAPARVQQNTAELPKRTPGVNMVSGITGERPPAGEQPRPPGPQRSADAAQNRLSGFQRGTRRAESTLRSRPAGPVPRRDS
jgi:signal transduction histidine kinase